MLYFCVSNIFLIKGFNQVFFLIVNKCSQKAKILRQMAVIVQMLLKDVYQISTVS